MTDALVFWLLVAGLGPVALPFADLLFGRLPARGLVFARPLGLLVVGFPVWLLASVHLVSYSRWSAFASIAVTIVVAGVLGRQGLGRSALTGEGRSLWLAAEAVFTVSFAAWSLLRSYAPDVWQTEKPMDMALVNVVNRSSAFPPHDPWLAGTHVNYYYFGHYLVGFLVRVTGIDPAVGYNLGVALFYALATTAVFGLAATLYSAARTGDDAPGRSPIVVGLTAAAFATVLGNLAGGIQLLQHTGRIGTYDWWSPSRVIPGTANEFPFFSFLLADLHAHVMATPFALTAVAYAMQLALHGPPRRRSPRAAAELALAAVVLGSLYAINSFDYPTACLIGCAALLLWTLAAPGRSRHAIVWAGAWLLGSVLAFLPFWLHFSAPAHGLSLVPDHQRFSRFAHDYLLLYGLPLWVVVALYTRRFRLPRRYVFWLGSVLLFVLVLLSPPRLAGPAVALLLAALAAFAALAAGRFSQIYRLLWLLLAVALILVASGELVYVRDAFVGTPSYRFNTVFKTGYQAWFLLAVVAGVSVHWSARWLGRRVRAAWLAGLAVLVTLALAYPAVGTYSRSARFARSPTLDGMRWLEREAPGDASAIEWLRGSVKGSPTVLETAGGDFDVEGRGRVSTFTGLPAVVEWPGHEVQWGHDPGARARDVQTIYETRDAAVARLLLARYRVRYVFVGSLERQDFPAASLRKFGRLGSVAFRSGETIVYRL